MSIVIYRDGVLAADSGTWIGESLLGVGRPLQKVYQGPHGLVGGVGSGSAYIHAKLLAKNGYCEKLTDRDNLIWVKPDGTLIVIDSSGQEEFDVPFMAIGAACTAVAFGAMHAGASAIEACEIAIRVGPWAAGPVQSVCILGLMTSKSYASLGRTSPPSSLEVAMRGPPEGLGYKDAMLREKLNEEPANDQTDPGDADPEEAQQIGSVPWRQSLGLE